MTDIRLGCSGWSYKEWEGIFYPSAEEPKLRYYSQIFPTVEIDSTFYAYPARGMVYGWLRSTGEGFMFAAKLPEVITHAKGLALEHGAEPDLLRFTDLMKPLQDTGKLGPLLIQLPPGLRRDEERLERFLEALPDGYHFACEFRHSSWWRPETWKLLRTYGVANVIVDEPLLPPEPVVTASFAFIRWHGRGKRPWYNYRYDIHELEPWVPRLRQVTSQVKELYGYFNNHFHGYAVANCLQMLELLGMITPKQQEVKQRALRWLEGAPQPTLLSFDPRVASRDDLLQLFLDRHRLQRAKEMEDREIMEVQFDGSRLKARIRGYGILIDAANHRVQHDCQDWEKQVAAKQFCKHLGKLLLTLPEAQALPLLRSLAAERDAWRFEMASSP